MRSLAICLTALPNFGVTANAALGQRLVGVQPRGGSAIRLILGW